MDNLISRLENFPRVLESISSSSQGIKQLKQSDREGLEESIKALESLEQLGNSLEANFKDEKSTWDAMFKARVLGSTMSDLDLKEKSPELIAIAKRIQTVCDKVSGTAHVHLYVDLSSSSEKTKKMQKLIFSLLLDKSRAAEEESFAGATHGSSTAIMANACKKYAQTDAFLKEGTPESEWAGRILRDVFVPAIQGAGITSANSGSKLAACATANKIALLKESPPPGSGELPVVLAVCAGTRLHATGITVERTGENTATVKVINTGLGIDKFHQKAPDGSGRFATTMVYKDVPLDKLTQPGVWEKLEKCGSRTIDEFYQIVQSEITAGGTYVPPSADADFQSPQAAGTCAFKWQQTFLRDLLISSVPPEHKDSMASVYKNLKASLFQKIGKSEIELLEDSNSNKEILRNLAQTKLALFSAEHQLRKAANDEEHSAKIKEKLVGFLKDSKLDEKARALENAAMDNNMKRFKALRDASKALASKWAKNGSPETLNSDDKALLGYTLARVEHTSFKDKQISEQRVLTQLQAPLIASYAELSKDGGTKFAKLFAHITSRLIEVGWIKFQTPMIRWLLSKAPNKEVIEAVKKELASKNRPDLIAELETLSLPTKGNK